MDEVLKVAVDVAKKKNISKVVIASTTGKTASRLLDLIGLDGLEVIVVTHDEGRALQQRRFDNDIRLKLLANNVTVYTHKPRMILLRKIIAKIFGRFGFPRWYRYLGKIKIRYGTGIKVCHIVLKMLIEGRALRNTRVVAIAGTKSGADSAGIFCVNAQNKWPVLEEVIVKSLVN